MADKAGVIQRRHDYTGHALYVTIQTEEGKYVHATTRVAETLVVADFADYGFNLTETPAGSYFYVGAWPEQLRPGWYRVTYHQCVGAARAITDPVLGSGFEWYGGGDGLIPIGGQPQLPGMV